MKTARIRSLSEQLLELQRDSHLVTGIPNSSHLLGERVQAVPYFGTRVRRGWR